MTNDTKMKTAIKKYNPKISQNILHDPGEVYHMNTKPMEKDLLVKDFTYTDFKKILTKSPFSLSEWADMLFMSERSIHRYAKEGTGFNGLQIERILLLESLVDIGNEMFGMDGFKVWLRSKPFVLRGDAPQDYLTTQSGIQEVIDILGRIQHGIPA